jgi:hypothetical protein
VADELADRQKTLKGVADELADRQKTLKGVASESADRQLLKPPPKINNQTNKSFLLWKIKLRGGGVFQLTISLPAYN